MSHVGVYSNGETVGLPGRREARLPGLGWDGLPINTNAEAKRRNHGFATDPETKGNGAGNSSFPPRPPLPQEEVLGMPRV